MELKPWRTAGVFYHNTKPLVQIPFLNKEAF